MKPENILSILSIGLFLALGAFWIEGCAQLGVAPSASKSVAALQPAVDTALNKLGTDGKITSGNAIAIGVQSATGLVAANINNPQLAQILTDAITTFAGDPGLKSVSRDLVSLALKDGGNAATIIGNLINTGIAASNAANK